MDKSTFIQLQNENSYDIYTQKSNWSWEEVYCKFYGEKVDGTTWVKYSCKPWIWFPIGEIEIVTEPTCELQHRSGCWRT